MAMREEGRLEYGQKRDENGQQEGRNLTDDEEGK